MTDCTNLGKAVLFDVDGTLLDTIPLIVESYQHTFSHFFDQPVDVADILAGIGIPLDTFFRSTWPDLADEMKKVYLEHNHARFDTHIAIFRQVPAMLDRLAAMGVPMGIVTSKSRYSAMRSLKDFDLDHYFQAFIVRESTQRHKPHPEPIFEAMRQMRLSDPSCIVFVGDSMHDLDCAKQAGCRSAIVDWTAMPVNGLMAAGPDLWLSSAGQLVDYLAGM